MPSCTSYLVNLFRDMRRKSIHYIRNHPDESIERKRRNLKMAWTMSFKRRIALRYLRQGYYYHPNFSDETELTQYLRIRGI